MKQLVLTLAVLCFLAAPTFAHTHALSRLTRSGYHAAAKTGKALYKTIAKAAPEVF